MQYKKEYKSSFKGFLPLNSLDELLFAGSCSEQYDDQWIALLSVLRELSGWVSIFVCTYEHIVFGEALLENWSKYMNN